VSDSNGFIEGTRGNEYDARGNYTPSEFDLPGDIIEPSPVKEDDISGYPEQVSVVASEDSGFRESNGNSREAIRARIRSVRPYTSQKVFVEEWSSEFEIRSMTLGDRANMTASLINDTDSKPDMRRMFPAVIVACTFDENGDHVFTSEDEGWLNSLDASTLDKIAKPAMELSGMSDKAVDKAAGKSDSTEAAA
jgi:hypothetical protein